MKRLLILVSSLVFPDLLQVIPASIHINVILFSTILVILTMLGTALFMYNAFGKPFETLHGPLGLYLLSFISGEYKILFLLPSTSTLTQRQMCFPRCQKTGLPKCKWQFIDMDVHRSVRYDCQSGEKCNYPTRGNLGSTLWWSIWINTGIKLYLWRCNQKDVCLYQKIKWIKLCNIL